MSSPSAKEEARALYQIARRNDGIPAVRELISVSEPQTEELRLWSNGTPALWYHVRGILIFRQQVLREFDRLAR